MREYFVFAKFGDVVFECICFGGGCNIRFPVFCCLFGFLYLLTFTYLVDEFDFVFVRKGHNVCFCVVSNS